MALVNAQHTFFEGSLINNLALWDDTIPKDAQIDSEILARPDGYETQVTSGAPAWSAGQRQRLEIALALVADPSILILDGNIDILTPRAIDRMERSLRQRGLTCVVVSHRSDWIRHCNSIVVLEQGQIAQWGRHDTLVAEEGPFKNMLGMEIT